MGRSKVDVPGQERPAGDVDRGLGQRLVHRHQRVAEAADAALVAERLGEGLAEHDADILGGVVEVDMQVALGPHRQVEQPVAGQRGQHVVEKADAGGDIGRPGPVEARVRLMSVSVVVRVRLAVRSMGGALTPAGGCGPELEWDGA